jgi:hypothetical protein
METESSRAYIEFVAEVKQRKAVCWESIENLSTFLINLSMFFWESGKELWAAHILLPFSFGK